MLMTRSEVAKSSGQYFSRIDTLRAAAALAVVYAHYFMPFLPTWLRIVPGGVDLFFILSGYLITTSLIADAPKMNGHQLLRSFYIKRSFRIFPLYYTTLAVTVAIGLYGAVQSWPWAAAYILNFSITQRIADAGYIGHFWTLAVEEQFYLVLPLLFCWLSRRTFTALGLSVIGAAIAFRTANLFNEPAGNLFNFNTLAEMDRLAIGSLLAVAVNAYGLDRTEVLLNRLLPLSLPSFVCCCFVSMMSGLMRVLTISFLTVFCSLFFAWLIIKAVRGGPRTSSWGGTLLPGIGALSYGIYLFHVPMMAAIHAVEKGSFSFIARCAAVVATVALAWVSFRFFEAPLIKVGRRLAQRQPATLPAGSLEAAPQRS